MANKAKKIDWDALTVRRFTSVARFLHEVFGVWRDRVLDKLTSHGHPSINMSHDVVLRNMDVEGTPLSIVTKRACLSRQAVAKVAGQLEALGYVTASRDPTDRRAKILKLSSKGIRLFADSIEAYGEFEDELAQTIGRRRLEQFRTTLRMISYGNRRERSMNETPTRPDH